MLKSAFLDFLGALVVGSTRHAKLVCLGAVALAGLSLWHASQTLSIDTDNVDLLSAELEFRQDQIALRGSFPQLSNNIAIVIDAATPGQADDAAALLTSALRQNPKLFPAVFDPASDPYFRKNGLLFLSRDKLISLTEQLIDSQAFIGKLWQDPSLRGLFGMLEAAIGSSDETPGGARLADAMRRITEVVVAAKNGPPKPLSWQALIGGGAPEPGRHIVLVQPVLDYSSLAPADAAMTEIRALGRRLGITPENGMRLRLTGSAPMEQEELASVAEGMGLAGLISVTLVLLLLWSAFRTPGLVCATLMTLFVGLIVTAGIATVVIGRLNLISVAFAVLFIGLSVDFALHLGLRLREADGGESLAAAAGTAARDTGPALVLCAVAAAIAFFSFSPTSYAGLAELGIIAGTGMFVALIANLTLMPACLSLFGGISANVSQSKPRRFLPHGWQYQYRHRIVICAALLAAGGALLSAEARFDFDPLNLRDRETESVSTALELINDAAGSHYTINILARDRKSADALVPKLIALPAVKDVRWANSFTPADQDEKRAIIDDAAFLLLPALSGLVRPAPTVAEMRQTVENFKKTASARLARENAALPPESRTAPENLVEALAVLPEGDAGWLALQKNLVGTLKGRLVALKTALSPGAATLENLPADTRDRYITPSGQWRVEVMPADDVRDPRRLKKFVADVRTVAPGATGAPVIIVEAGRAVIDAFLTAGAISVIGISVLVLLLLRSLRDLALIFIPLCLAALLTGSFSVLAGVPFNFANIIVLPLLFGLGVASAIHLVMRQRSAGRKLGLFATSTPRAVIFSALTTIGSFASIAVSSHPGTASMGVLLAVSIGLTLLCTMIVLPALPGFRRKDEGG